MPAPPCDRQGNFNEERRVDAVPARQGALGAPPLSSGPWEALLERVVRTAGQRPGRVLLAVALVAGISAVLALRLEPSTAVETLVGKSSDSYRATEVYRQRSATTRSSCSSTATCPTSC